MALIVEDGTGLVTADSFVSVASASTYHTARGNAAWAALASDTVREQALRKATDYMEGEYRSRWAGYRVTTTQALSWPRYEVPMLDTASSGYPFGAYWASDAVPTIVANACAELALRAAAGDLLADLARAVRRERVGPIETEYEPGSLQSTRYAAIDAMLAPFLRARAGFLMVERA